MKRLLLVSLVLLTPALFAAPAQAQNLSAGVKAGVAIANLGGDVEGTDSKLGFAGGAFLGLQLHEYFAVQLNGQYVQKGASDEEAGEDFDIKLDYIEILVPATLTIPMQGSIVPRLFAGPAIGLEVSCKFSNGDSVDCEDLGIETKSVDFGVFFGGGVDFMVGNGAIILEALYNLGLADINDTEGDEGEIKNQNIQILAGYKIPLGS